MNMNTNKSVVNQNPAKDITTVTDAKKGNCALSFTINIKPVTKKNSQRIVKVGKYHKILPSKAYMEYEKNVAPWMPKMEAPIQRPVNVKAVYYMPARRACDLVNLHEALCDVLVKYKVIEDDNYRYIHSMDGSYVTVDCVNPRTEVFISWI